MTDASHCKVHPHAAGEKGGHQAMSRSKGGSTQKLHLTVDAHGMLLRIIVTDGTCADCTQAVGLIAGINAENLIADKAYDTDAIIQCAKDGAMNPIIPPKSNRVIQREYDRHIYKQRHLIENAFLHLSAGGASQHATPRILHHSLWRCRFVV